MWLYSKSEVTWPDTPSYKNCLHRIYKSGKCDGSSKLQRCHARRLSNKVRLHVLPLYLLALPEIIKSLSQFDCASSPFTTLMRADVTAILFHVKIFQYRVSPSKTPVRLRKNERNSRTSRSRSNSNDSTVLLAQS